MNQISSLGTSKYTPYFATEEKLGQLSLQLSGKLACMLKVVVMYISCSVHWDTFPLPGRNVQEKGCGYLWALSIQ